MKIVVMSDSHRKTNLVKEIMEKESDAQYFIHCGDICENIKIPNLHVVMGNNDIFFDLPNEILLDLNGIKTVVIHSHQFFYNRDKDMVEYAKKVNCKLMLSGHTHVAHYEVIDGITFINPGALFCPRDGKGPGYCILNINDNVIDHEFIKL